MKKGFTTFLSALKANTPPCKKGHPSLRFLSLFLILFLAVGNAWGATDFSKLNYSKENAIPSGYTLSSSSNAPNIVEINSPVKGNSINISNGGSSDYTAGNLPTKRFMTFVIDEDCSVMIKFTSSSTGRTLNLVPASTKTAVASVSVSSKNAEHTLSYDFSGITSATTYYLCGTSNSNLYIYSIQFTPTYDCTETAPTSVAVSGGATYDKGDALSNLSAAVTGGTGTMSYQWYCNTTDAATVDKEHKIADVTSATLAPYNKVGTRYYYCVASNCAGSVTSGTTAVTINANCSATGDIFTITMNSSNAPSSEVKTPASSTMSIDTYINIDGGDIVLVTGSSQHSSITTSPKIKLGGSSGYAKITLDCPLQEGDKITFVKTNKIALAADASGTNKIQLPSGTNEYTVTKEDCLYNQSNLFVLRDGSNVEISAITITRPAPKESHTLSYVVDPTDKATVTLSATSVEEEGTATATYSAIDPAYEFDEWQISGTDASIDNAKANPVTITMGTDNAVVTLKLKPATTKYAVTKGTHINGDFTITPAEQEENGIVTLIATPSTDYMFSAWEVVKTDDASATGITVNANGEFTMPGYPVTVNATFVADTRKKVLYVTSTAEATVKENDKLYDALKDIYNISIVGPTSDADQSGYDLVVLHESVGGSSFNAAAVAAAKTGSTPVLNTKSYFYNNDRFGWGTPNAGKTIKGATLNSAYCNIASHPLFAGVTVTDGFFEITDEAAAKCMQPVGSFVAGKEGYTLATTPNNDSGEGCAIHELTPAQRGASAGKYLMISVSNDKLNALNANGQKLFQNAAAYLIGSTSWTPVLVPTTPEIAGTTAYSAGETIELTASATGESATTTYTWYKGATLEEAKEAGAIQAAKTIAENGNVYSKAECVVGDAGIYWCVISNGTDCEANVSVEITVSDASYNASFVSAYGTAPVATSGVSYTLPELTESGYVHQGWTANIDVTVDEAVVTAGTTIANGKTAIFGADVTFTAVWKQIFAVTFNMNDHGDAIDPQDIIEGGKVTKPADPVVIGYDFGGWYTEAECTNVWDFATVLTGNITLYAKWTEFEGCAWLVPKTSGDALIVGAMVDLQAGSVGGSIKVANLGAEGSIAYNANGLSFSNGGKDSVLVTLNNDLKNGSIIKVRLMANGGTKDSGRGLNLYNAARVKKALLGWQANEEVTSGDIREFTYTVVESDGFAGTNVFTLQRQNSVFLQSIKVTNCGDAIVYHNLTSAVDPEDKGTVTLGAVSVREGYTTTATYSEIDPLYEFVNWTVSGEGASVADATANPATITVGTEDAVVTLNLRLIPVKFTVEYYDGATAMGTEQVVVNEYPTASDIETAKRGYVFEGWATSSTATASDVIALNTITSDVTTTINLYAVYTEIPCPTEGTVFSMNITDPAGTEYNGNNEFNLEIGATYVGGKAYSGSKNSTNRKGAIDGNGEYSFAASGDVTVKVAMDCALQEGDVITFTTSTTRELKIQKVAGTDLVTTSGKKYVIPAESPLIGVYDFYLERGNSQSTIKTFNVTRPYTVSFDMQGHGDAIEAQKLIAGDKVVEPTAPTADGWDFKGWYKESACTNAWDFENDVVAGTMALYAKWDVHVTNDATLKSLKYGSEAIALEDGVFEYNIGLPALTASVPALTAVANSATVHSLDIVDAAAFDDGNATSTVTVVSEDETVTNIYTVNFSKLAALPLADVTGSTTWDFANAVTANVSITETPQVLANYAGVTNDNTFESDKLEASGEKFTAGSKANLRANYIHFHTTVPGMLTISYSNTGGNSARYIYVNGAKYDEDGSANTTPKGADNKVFVPAGNVELVMMDGEDASKNVQIYQMIFNANPDYTRDVTEGRYGTICLPNGGVMVGASLFELSYYNEAQGLLYMDEADATMVAGNPYIFLPSDGVAQIKVYYTDEENAAANTVNGLVGYLDNEDMQLEGDGTNYILKDNKIKKVVGGSNSNVFVTKNRAYIKLGAVNPNESAPVPGRRRVSMGMAGQNTATGVDQVQGDEVPTKMIINGQLFILRGEKMYDAQGKLVK